MVFFGDDQVGFLVFWWWPIKWGIALWFKVFEAINEMGFWWRRVFGCYMMGHLGNWFVIWSFGSNQWICFWRIIWWLIKDIGHKLGSFRGVWCIVLLGVEFDGLCWLVTDVGFHVLTFTFGFELCCSMKFTSVWRMV